MILISHRGNISGAQPVGENSPEYILEAMSLGYDVEIDVWRVGGEWFLGHDEPEYAIEEAFLLKEGLWCHAKNIDALEDLMALGVDCFWHQKDSYTLTSNGFIWAYPGRPLSSAAICVMPENQATENHDFSRCSGICSDKIEYFKELISEA
jgi:hypothetical protein